MIYIIGDRHGEKDGFSEEMLPGQSAWTAEDIVIVTGDFGYVMRGEKRNSEEKDKLDTLSAKPYTVLFCDGNHENFPLLEQYPEQIRFGAPVRRIRDNVFWLQRGYIYTIGGHTFFVMGGAYSMDKAWRMKYEAICGEKIWFEQELPSSQEYRRAIATVEDCGHKVDYIITHTAPRSIIPRLIQGYPDPHDQELTGFLNWVYHEVSFRQWYFGHFHLDCQVNAQMIACYEQIHSIQPRGQSHCQAD